jgi:hypothetical protein
MLMKSHLVNLIVFSSLVSLVFAFLLRDGASQRLRFALLAFLGLVLGTVAIGWLMRPFPN